MIAKFQRLMRRFYLILFQSKMCFFRKKKHFNLVAFSGLILQRTPLNRHYDMKERT